MRAAPSLPHEEPTHEPTHEPMHEPMQRLMQTTHHVYTKKAGASVDEKGKQKEKEKDKEEEKEKERNSKTRTKREKKRRRKPAIIRPPPPRPPPPPPPPVAHLQGPRRTSYSSARATRGATAGSRSGSSSPRRASSATARHPPCQLVSPAPAAGGGRAGQSGLCGFGVLRYYPWLNYIWVQAGSCAAREQAQGLLFSLAATASSVGFPCLQLGAQGPAAAGGLPQKPKSSVSRQRQTVQHVAGSARQRGAA